MIGTVIVSAIGLRTLKEGVEVINKGRLYWIKKMKRLFHHNRLKGISDDNGIDHSAYGKNIHIQEPKIVVIGGGTGLSTMLRGLKKYTSNITAVVTVADDGGGSGLLRQDLGMLPPGDIRNCILALASTEPIMEQLLQYRFTEGSLKGQSFGNLFLAAMNGISSNFEEAIKKVSDVLAVTGRVLPVTLQDIQLCAVLENGVKVCGESKIGQQKLIHNSPIKKVYLMPEHVIPLPEVVEAIFEADMIIIGPGSLYTSILPNLLVKGVVKAIRNSNGAKLYICNVMTQPGETEGYSAYDHIAAIEKHAGKGLIDYCIVNKQEVPQALLEPYIDDGAQPVTIDRSRFERGNIKLLEGNILKVFHTYIRHDTDKLASMIAGLIFDEVLSEDEKRIGHYADVKDRPEERQVKMTSSANNE